jgi:hypothetical protein
MPSGRFDQPTRFSESSKSNSTAAFCWTPKVARKALAAATIAVL